jgi:hypothetical protein
MLSDAGRPAVHQARGGGQARPRSRDHGVGQRFPRRSRRPAPTAAVRPQRELFGHPLRHAVTFCFAGGDPSGVASSYLVDVRLHPDDAIHEIRSCAPPGAHPLDSCGLAVQAVTSVTLPRRVSVQRSGCDDADLRCGGQRCQRSSLVHLVPRRVAATCFSAPGLDPRAGGPPCRCGQTVRRDWPAASAPRGRSRRCAALELILID